MAGKPQNRLELRRQYEAAEPLDPMEDESEEVVDTDDDSEEERRPKKKKPAKPKAKAAKPAKPAARVRIVWAVVNDAFKTVATFEFSQKEAAVARAAELTAKGKGTHFIQRVKEPMPDNAPGLGANIPRTAPAAAAVAAKVVEPVEDDEEEEIEDDDDFDAEPEGDDEE